MNRLGDERSPYLQQYRDQPVDWYPWGDEAFAEARRRDVPILLSIGYAACHWCHVMAREVYTDADVATAMNAAFVNILVDREERPDVDALYMESFQAMSGRGGWPLTMALDTDGRAFWGATYVPRDQFVKVIDAITGAWTSQRAELHDNAAKIVATLTTRAEVSPAEATPNVDAINTALASLGAAFDPEFGGFGRTPKFPQAFHLELVLRAYMTSGTEGPKTVVTTSLDAMAAGGVRDQFGGGFHRYATDREWVVPHFEKMLSDQAILGRLYRHVFAVIGNVEYRNVLVDTVEYALRELRLPGGGFATSHDADSFGADGLAHEGSYYVWTPDEVRQALAPLDAKVVDQVLAWYHIDDDGDLEVAGQRVSVPNRIPERGEIATPAALDQVRRRLAEVRLARPKPARDDQAITEWNAMMITTLAESATSVRKPEWVQAAVECAEFLLEELRDERGRWRRSWTETGGGQHHASASDYAALIEAFVSLYEATGEPQWVEEAVATADTMLDWYWDPADGGLYRTAEDGPALNVRQKDLIDAATPSANSVAAAGLLKLAALTGEMRYRNHAERILQLMGPVIAEFPAGVSNTLLALDTFHRGFVEVVITGDRPDLVRLAQLMWRPNQVLAWGEPFESPLWEDRPANGVAYVCHDGACEAPITTIEELFRSLTGQEPPDGLAGFVGA